LTKLNFNYDKVNSDFLMELKAGRLLISFWRHNDAVAALFIDRFYSHLKSAKSVYTAFQTAQKEIAQKFKSPFLNENFILLF
ncbi:MAG: hypothetical protein PHF84_10715, partial [bacterium]|nr:hypothetical protein [bacterium]